MMSTSLRQTLALVAAITASFAVFALWPGLDLLVTGLFRDPVARFSGADSGWPNVARLGVWRVSQAVLFVALVALVYRILRRRDAFEVPARVWVYVVGLYAIGPGLLVDQILKPVWGRARPANVVEFGGPLAFTPPTQFSEECARNCSFVSGEVSGAVALAVCLVVILTRFRDQMGVITYRFATSTVLVIPLFIAWQRIAAGRHFLSDAIFAVLFTLLVAVLLHAVLGRKGWIARPRGQP